MKKTVIFILSLFILLSVLPISVYAEDFIWSVSPMGELYIIGNGNIPDYEKGEAPWLVNAESIKSVVINGGIYSIGENAFSGLTLTSATLDESVGYISESAFDSYDIFFMTDFDSYTYNFIKERLPEYDCGGSHTFTAYKVIKPATYTEKGEQRRGCTRCFFEESMEIGTLALPSASYEIYNSTITLKNLYGIRDIYFAKGTQMTYRDVKNNLIYGVTSAKLGNSTEYTYTLSSSGMHTVYIRFADQRPDQRIIININVTKPTFTPGNGKLTIKNIDNAKVIRIAKGVHDSVASMKTSGTIVNYTGRIINTESFTLKFTTNYEYYTIAVEYKTGYIELYKYVVYGVL